MGSLASGAGAEVSACSSAGTESPKSKATCFFFFFFIPANKSTSGSATGGQLS